MRSMPPCSDAETTAGPSAGSAPEDEHPLDASGAGNRAIRGGATRVAAYVVGAGSGAVGAIILTRTLGVVDFGRYVTVLSIVTALAGLSEAGLTTIGIREYATREGAERPAFMADLLGLRLVFCGLSLLIAVAFSWLAGYDEVMVAGTVLASLGLTATVLQSQASIPLQASIRLVAVSWLELLRPVASTVAIAVIALLGGGLLAYLGSPLVGGLVALAATLPLVRGALPFRPTFHGGRWRRVLKDTVAVTAATAIGALYYRVAIIVLSLVSTGTQTGYFSASFRIIEIVIAVPNVLVLSSFPILSRSASRDQDRLAYVLQRLVDVAIVLGPLTAILIVFGAAPAIDILGGAAFAPAIDVLRIQGLAVAATFFVVTFAFALVSIRANRAILWANAGVLALALAVSIALSSAHGAIGAAIAMTITEVALATVYAVLVARHRADLRFSFATAPRVAVAVVPAVAVGVLMPGPAILVTMLAGAVFLVGAWILRAVPAEVGDAVRERLRPGRPA